MSLTWTLIVALIGSWILYFVGYYGVELFVNKCLKKYPKQQKTIKALFVWVSCTVGRLEPEKNLSFLFKGMKELRDRYQDKFHLLILGDGTKRKELREEVKMLGMEEQITFVGNVSQDEITNYYKACDLFVFSSKSET